MCRFSSHCPSPALLSVCDAYTHIDTRAQILSWDLSLLVSYIYLKLCLKSLHKRGLWASPCLHLKGNVCQIPVDSTIAKPAKLCWQSHDLCQTLKPPLAQLHLNWDVPNISKRSHIWIWKRSLTEIEVETHPSPKNWTITTLPCT